jgi:hypothetical protein
MKTLERRQIKKRLNTRKCKGFAKGVGRCAIDQKIALGHWYAPDARRRGMSLELVQKLLLGNTLHPSVDLLLLI